MKRTAPQKFCVVRIGYQTLLMEMKDGMRVIELLNGAVEVETDFSGSRTKYRLGESIDVECRSVRHDDLIVKNAPVAPASPLQITHQRKRLPAP